MQLRPYQQKISDDIDAAWHDGARNVLAVLPTGAGKTATFGFLVGQAMKASKGKANPKVVNQLLKQALETQ